MWVNNEFCQTWWSFLELGLANSKFEVASLWLSTLKLNQTSWGEQACFKWIFWHTVFYWCLCPTIINKMQGKNDGGACLGVENKNLWHSKFKDFLAIFLRAHPYSNHHLSKQQKYSCILDLVYLEFNFNSF